MTNHNNVETPYDKGNINMTNKKTQWCWGENQLLAQRNKPEGERDKNTKWSPERDGFIGFDIPTGELVRVEYHTA